VTQKVSQALTRLQAILPLKARQEHCAPPIKRLHQKILQTFVDEGRLLHKEEMLSYVACADDAIAVLMKNDLLIASKAGIPNGAYPFTLEKREHQVQVNAHNLYALCALDALAISPMFNRPTCIRSRCGVTGDDLLIRQSGQHIERVSGVSEWYFAIDWSAVDSHSCCASSLCLRMIFLRDNAVAQEWVLGGEAREVFNVVESIEFASRFFVPLMA
jgi:mercuric reductase